MSQCGMDFQSIPLHITYNFQHVEPIENVVSLGFCLFFKQMIPKFI
jgi:hypothetical protein